ncbi:MAG: primosomal protein N' [Burkholderiales bacterium]
MIAPATIARVALDLPLPELFDYALSADSPISPGDWVIVPWGRSRRVGLVAALTDSTTVPSDRLRMLEERLPGMPRMPGHWLELIGFGSRYYHAGFGELALPAVPKLLRTVPGARSRGSAVVRARERFEANLPKPADIVDDPGGERVLTSGQTQALEQIQSCAGHAVFLLHGITGSGKTEVYFRWLAALLARDPAAQALVLVPEIALTPQFAQRIRERFPTLPLAILHSDMPDAERAAHWLAAAEGRARIVLGTRLAVLVPLPALVAVVVDEEHDASFKQQEGARYSARDLAIALAARRGLPIVLGSATPSLESWHAARRGRYRLVSLRERASGTSLPLVQRMALRGARVQHGLTDPAIAAINDTVARGEQALIFLNRRGYAPVLNCGACGWLSRCDQCDAYRVMHRVTQKLTPKVTHAATNQARATPNPPSSGKTEPPRSQADDHLPAAPHRYRLVCHHCGADQPVPRSCPECGNVDLAGLGRGTQRLEEGLQALFPSARIGRLDRDVARRRGAAQQMLDAAHAGEVDLLVGTQMLAKGHDFRQLTLVVVVDADAALFAADFRAPERLFATLMQVAGRAGRHHAASRVLIQTRFPEHPVFVALAAHDFDRFAADQLAEREQASLPPFVHQALLTVQARSADDTIAFLADARRRLLSADTDPPIPDAVLAALTVCDPVPMPLAQMRGLARAQMLIESPSRPALHAALGPWLAALRAQRHASRWQLVVDPLEI